MDEEGAEHVPVRPDGLQIRENRRLQRFHWRVQRVAWLGFIALVVAAGLGFTGGGGGFARQDLQLGPARLDLPAFSRWQRSDSMTISFAGAAGDGGAREVIFGPGFLGLFMVEQITPAPMAQTTGAEGLRLRFDAAEGKVLISVRPHRPGAGRYEVFAGGAEAAVRTLVLP